MQSFHNLLGVDPFARGVQIALLPVSAGKLDRPTFRRVKCRIPFPQLAALRPMLATGDLQAYAQLTFKPVKDFAQVFWLEAGALSPSVIVVDAPSGFSRNTRGHGRRCERVGYSETSLQMTPSIDCGAKHLGSGWGFIPVGMSVFMSALFCGGSFGYTDWEKALCDGLHPKLATSTTPIVREGCPTAQIGDWRASNRHAHVASMLHSLVADSVVNVVIDYLKYGVSAVKRRGPRYDSADALVAALSGLPHVAGGSPAESVFQEVYTWPVAERRGVKWAAIVPHADQAEGAFVLSR